MQGTMRKSPRRELELARVLLVDDDLASRLTLQAVLEPVAISSIPPPPPPKPSENWMSGNMSLS